MLDYITTTTGRDGLCMVKSFYAKVSIVDQLGFCATGQHTDSGIDELSNFADEPCWLVAARQVSFHNPIVASPHLPSEVL